MVLFFDACIIIYWMEMAEPGYSKFLTQFKKLKKAHPKSRIAISRLNYLECLVKPIRDDDRDILESYQTFFTAPDLQIIEITPAIIHEATILRANSNLKTPDAIQAASAMSISGKVLFISNDKAFAKIKGLDFQIL